MQGKMGELQCGMGSGFAVVIGYWVGMYMLYGYS